MGLVDTPLSGNGNREWRVSVPPTVAPITVDEVKLFARIDGSGEDSLIQTFIQAARENAERYLGRALIQQTMNMCLDYWPEGSIRLPRPPLISVSGVYTVDEDGVRAVYAASNYLSRVGTIYGEITVRAAKQPPINLNRDRGGIEIDWLAGYGPAGSNVPAAIRTGLMLWAATGYENRVVDSAPPPEASKLLKIYRVHPGVYTGD